MQTTLFDLLPGPLEGDTREAYLIHISPDRNCFRFYNVSVEPNLFGDTSMVIHWGRLGTLGNIRIASSGSLQSTHKKARELARLKIKRGYLQRPTKTKTASASRHLSALRPRGTVNDNRDAVLD